jgi:uncharacterized damage-inducible protein DinB
MPLKDGLIAELKHESASTKKILEKIPVESLSWKPHEKSMSLGRLATHIAEIPNWVPNIITMDVFDFAERSYKPTVLTSQEELLNIFNKNVSKAIAALETTNTEALDKIWTVANSGKVVYQLPRKVALRGWAYSHLYHHRGQLTVYLRLLGIPVPGMYGPTADESM